MKAEKKAKRAAAKEESRKAKSVSFEDAPKEGDEKPGLPTAE